MLGSSCSPKSSGWILWPSRPSDVDAEYYKKQVRGRGLGRKPHELIVRIAGEAARLQLDSESSSRIDRHGLVVKYSRVVGATSRALREQLEAGIVSTFAGTGTVPMEQIFTAAAMQR